MEQTIPDETVRDACIRLTHALWDHLDDESNSWTYKSLSQFLGVSPSDPVLHRCIALLTSRPNIKFLDMHFLYFDPDEEGSPGEYMDDEAVSSAYRDGYLIDPNDGREVYNFERALVPYFSICEKVKGHGTDR
ncbi:hypothetical protein [uncultured Xanthomonas sp.]|uniref:hypothetical protein n=1 Tax=uncultured Xanthomonas sp. TaxID=152831 RepID=UPI0025E97C63|nr:hypothetical protein [uncultured Xanthomonas sp.]